MKRFAASLIVVAVAWVVLGASAAWGQYYTPLRYDLRYTSPTYIPSGTLRFGPYRNPDPYRFGQPLHGNLAVTGNLRLGKSFKGSSPYVASGSQLTQDLPSTALSNFRRDSIGIEDLGTGLEYGAPTAYYPDTASVTSSWTAGRRFDHGRFGDRVRYLTPNYNVPPTEPFYQPDNVYTSDGGWTGLVPEDYGAGLGYVGVPDTTEGPLAPVLPDSRLWMLGGEAKGDRETEQEAGRPESPYEMFQKRFETRPMNLLDAEAKPGEGHETAPQEHLLKLQYTAEATDLDTLFLPEDDVEAAEAAGAPDRREGGDEGWGPTADDFWPDDPAAGPDVGEPLPAETPSAPGPPVPVAPASAYARYVLRAHEALKTGQYGRAEALYAAAAALERDRPAAWFGRVHALLAARLYLQAATVLEQGLKKHPEWARHVPDLQGVYTDPDVCPRILRDVKRDAEREAGGGMYRFLLGYLAYASGNMEEARQHLTAAAGARTAKAGAETVILNAIGPE